MKNSFAYDIKGVTYALINCFCINLLFTFPKRLVITSGNAAWIQMLFLFSIMLLIFWFIQKSFQKFPGYDIIDLSELAGGKGFRKIFGSFILVSLFFNLASVVRRYPDMVKMILLPDTPIEIILLIFSVVVAASAYFGIGSILRIHSLYIPLFIGVVIIFLIFLIPHFDIYNIFPILGEGAEKIFLKGMGSVDFFDDIILLSLLIPGMEKPADAKRCGYRAIIVSGILASFVVFSYCMIYPYPASEKFIIPIYQLTRLVGIGDFFQRFEAFFEFLWSISVFLYASLYISVMASVFKKTFEIKEERNAIFPIIALTSILSYTSKDTSELVFNYPFIWWYVIGAAYISPVLLSAISEKKRNKLSSDKKGELS